MTRRLSFFAVLLAALLLFVAACDENGNIELPGSSTTSGGSETTPPPETTTPPETTEPPATTEAPATTAAPTDEDLEDWAPLLILIGVLLIVLLIGLLVGRGRGSTTVVAAPPAASWQDAARKGYSDARWLSDQMTEDLAIWRGNAQFERTTGGDTPGTAQAETWSNVPARMDAAKDSLYAMEAAAPDSNTAEVARGTVTSLNAVRSAVDSRAEARFAFRSVAPDSGDEVKAEARDRELRATENLREARRQLHTSLTSLNTLL